MPVSSILQAARPVALVDSYPAGATVVTAGVVAASGTSSQASLPAVANKLNYISGFQITTAGGASTAAPLVTVSGVAGSTLAYQAPVAGSIGNASALVISFVPPVPATAANTAITVSLASNGTTGNATIAVQGFNI